MATSNLNPSVLCYYDNGKDIMHMTNNQYLFIYIYSHLLSYYFIGWTRQAVYSIAFSPNGDYLASGSVDRYIHIWSMKEGKVVKTYKGDGGIFEVCWNKEGDQIAGCFSNNTVCVLNFRM